MIHNTLAIFNSSELEEVEATLFQSILLPQGAKNQLVKMCEDYRFLVSSLYAARGLSQQVILFLLSPDSCTVAEVDKFLEKLEFWVMILENENEQRMYAEILRYSYYKEEEILALRSNLIDILQELDEVKVKTLKKLKNNQDIIVKNKIPMQLVEGFEDSYGMWMDSYGAEFEEDSSPFNIVPNLKGKFSSDQTPFYDSFSVYVENWEVPTKD